MSKQLYAVRNKETGKVFKHDYTNSLELVNNGYFEWAGGDVDSKESSVSDDTSQTSSDSDDTSQTSSDTGDDSQTSSDELPDLEDMDREELIAFAEAHNVTIDKRMGAKALIKAIVDSTDAV